MGFPNPGPNVTIYPNQNNPGPVFVIAATQANLNAAIDYVNVLVNLGFSLSVIGPWFDGINQNFVVTYAPLAQIGHFT